MFTFAISPEALLALLGVIVSLTFSYFPKLRVRFASLTAEAKSGIMIGVLFLLTSAVFGLGCGNILIIGLACDQNGVIHIVVAFIAALVSNQGTWGVTKNLPAPDVKALKK